MQRGRFNDTAVGKGPEDAEAAALKGGEEEQSRHGPRWHHPSKSGNASGNHQGSGADDERFVALWRGGHEN